MNIHSLFHPAVARWFEKTFAAPTPAQVDAWPAIQSGKHVLIAAPTGSGKTLAAFLAAIDELVREGAQWGLPDETRVLYVSPLKALSNDISRNLEAPLAGIRAELASDTVRDVELRAWVRTGDTPHYERAQMRRKPPHIVVTTPESLYILLSSPSGREMLATVRTVIVDEIHAVAGNKRGSHLALSLERLDALTPHRLLRVGLSATQRPIDEVARFLVGMRNQSAGRVECTIVDSGHVRHRDLQLELPDSPLEAVMSGEVWTQVYDRLAQLVREHRTTLVFVNTRRMAERVARHLAERIDGEADGGRRTADGEGRASDILPDPNTPDDVAESSRRPGGKSTRALSSPSTVRRPPSASSLVAAHHGSLAKELRFNAEQRLKRGELKVLVATASLELGIDIGDVDLVCQLGTPRSINALLQRVGRSGHAVGGTPKGRLFPLSRDDLVECTALLDSIRRGELDRIEIPRNALDVLSQQVVAEVAARDYGDAELYGLLRSAYPYRSLERETFDEVVRMLAEGFTTRRGRHGALIYHDAVNHILRGRKGARLTAITSGGAIPDTADYQVMLEPEGQLIGTVNEDFAVESLQGDVFQLGNASYRILRVERSMVRVEDAHGEAPSIPFWLGEAPGRTDELSVVVSRLRGEIQELLQADGGRRTADSAPETEWSSGAADISDSLLQDSPQSSGDGGALSPSAVRRPPSASPAVFSYLTREIGISEPAALQLADYLAAAHAALGCLPTQHTIVFERFFDEAGGMQLVIHSPFGSRVNRAWGLALRKRFCRTFNFELQAAATEDTIILSLTTAHSFELAEVARYLHPNTAREILIQALLAAPMFTTRWRWTASIALALPRFRGGKKVPPQLARMNAEDLLASVFPDQVACGENIVGDIVVPEHPLVQQTVRDCLEEAMDIDGFEGVLNRMLAGEIRIEARDLTEPSPLALEVLSARPYAYLDDAPLEERRTQAVMSRRWMNPSSAADIGKLDPAALARVREEAWPDATTPDELHDALTWLTFMTEQEVQRNMLWPALIQRLVTERRVVRVGHWALGAGLPPDRSGPEPTSDAKQTTFEKRPEDSLPTIVIPAEHLPLFAALFTGAAFDPTITAPDSHRKQYAREEALSAVVRGRLEGLGPTTAAQIADSLDLPLGDVDTALVALEAEGSAMRGTFDVSFNLSSEPSTQAPSLRGQRPAEPTAPQWCDRRLLARIHRYTMKRLRAEIEPVQARDFLRFLFDWQRATSATRMQGPDALGSVLAQLEGFDAPAGSWETEILPSRIDEYEPAWLDEQCLAGRIVWTRLASRSGDAERGAAPVKSTPIALLARRNVKWWSEFSSIAERLQLTSKAERTAEFIRMHGASFFDEIVEGSGLLPNQAEEALAELVALGLVNSDSFGGLRALLVPSDRRRPAAGARRRRRIAIFGMQDAGRCAMVRKGHWAWGAGLGQVEEKKQDVGHDRLAVSDQRRSASALARASGSVPHVHTPESLEHLCRTLLRRWGVVFWKLLEREANWMPPWRDILRCLRRLEARGEIRGGRFVAGFSGEQFAAPEAIGLLRDARRKENAGELLSLSAADPLNLVGIVTPGSRLPALTSNRVLYRDGVPIAVFAGGEVKFLEELEPKERWEAQNVLLRRPVPAPLADLA